jgi:hypothetical protein
MFEGAKVRNYAKPETEKLIKTKLPQLSGFIADCIVSKFNAM